MIDEHIYERLDVMREKKLKKKDTYEMPYDDIVTTFTILEDTKRLIVYISSICLDRMSYGQELPVYYKTIVTIHKGITAVMYHCHFSVLS